MFSPDIPFFWVTFFAYLIATILYAFWLATRKKGMLTSAVWLMVLGFCSETIALILRSIRIQHLPLTGLYEYTTLFSWIIVLVYFFIHFKVKLPLVGAFIAPVSFMLIAIGSLMPKHPEMQLVPALQSYWLTIHVTLAVIGEGIFAVAFATSIMYLIKERLLKKDRAKGWFVRSSPSLERLDEISYKSITFGYPLFTIGALFAGAVWAQKTWGSPWSWDPKETSSLIVWLIYSAYLHARYVKHWKGKRAAWLSIIGFATAIFTMLGSLFLAGLHSYGR